MERRKFIQNSGLLATGIYHSPLKAIAGPFVQSPLLHNIPIDKKLNPAWIKSLYHRGFVTTYKKTKNELQYIGRCQSSLCWGLFALSYKNCIHKASY
jgi:hypothetical protein